MSTETARHTRTRYRGYTATQAHKKIAAGAGGARIENLLHRYMPGIDAQLFISPGCDLAVVVYTSRDTGKVQRVLLNGITEGRDYMRAERHYRDQRGIKPTLPMPLWAMDTGESDAELYSMISHADRYERERAAREQAAR